MTIALISAATGCGDDGEPVDSSVPTDTSTPTDTTVPEDASPDSAADTSVPVDSAADTSMPADSAVDAMADAAPTTGTVAGTATSTVTCASAAGVDCVGDVHVVLFDAAVPWTSTVVARVTVAAADLSGGAGVAFIIADVPPGSWFLSAFQDDDGNADPSTPLPDMGDPAHGGTLPVTVTAGMAATQDVVLDQRVP